MQIDETTGAPPQASPGSGESPPLTALATAASAAAMLSGCFEEAIPTADEASRFLSQAAPGHSLEDIRALTQMSYGDWIEAQFALPRERTHWDWLVYEARPKTPGIVAKVFLADMVYWSIWRRLITAPDLLRARVMFALSEIFVVAPGGLGNELQLQYLVGGFMDVLDEHAFGNFRDLLEAVSLNPAMGLYLSHAGNAKADGSGRTPDENYAREILQLFSIGLYELNPDGTQKLGSDGQPIETYGQEDIVKLARVFTGWNFDLPTFADSEDPVTRLPMTMHEELHAHEDKDFLGAPIPGATNGTQSLKLALDFIFNHPNVGPFIGRQLIQRLVTSNPSPGYVGSVAKAFADNGAGVRGDMKAVLRAILLSPEARLLPGLGDATGKLREPALRLAHFARAFHATSENGLWRLHDRVSGLDHDLSDAATGLGQQPMASPSVFNFFRPGYVPPNTAIAEAGLVAPEFQIVNETSVIGYLNFMQSLIVDGLRDNVGSATVKPYALKPDYAGWLPLADQPVQLVAQLSSVFTASRLQPADAQAMADAIAQIAAGDDAGRSRRVQAAALLVLGAPAFLVQQ
ncbi:MAG: DUF1800 domain-containing protein [Aquabacterium sp.]|nr:MAG: DUF1800 domain-containing protein [Aquabacterium sp.]